MKKSRIVDLIEGKKIDGDKTEVNLIRGSEIELKAVQWLWHGWLARGKFHVLAGRSFLETEAIASSLVATVTQARFWPDHTQCKKAGNVFIVSYYDNVADWTKKLIAARANLDRVYFVNPDEDPDKDILAELDLKSKIATKFKDLLPDLVIVDSYYGNYEKISKIAVDAGCAVIHKTTVGIPYLTDMDSNMILLSADVDGHYLSSGLSYMLCRIKPCAGLVGGGISYDLIEENTEYGFSEHEMMFGDAIQDKDEVLYSSSLIYFAHHILGRNALHKKSGTGWLDRLKKLEAKD